MKLIATSSVYRGGGRAEFCGWYADGRPRVRVVGSEVKPSEVFEVDDQTAERMIRDRVARPLNEAEILLNQMQEKDS